MTNKAKQLGRILKIQVELRKDAEARLGRLNAQRVELEAAEAAILDTLTSNEPHRRALAPLAEARLRFVNRSLNENEADRAAAEERWRKIAQNSLVAERLEKAARASERQQQERKDLEDLLADVESRRTSLP